MKSMITIWKKSRYNYIILISFIFHNILINYDLFIIIKSLDEKIKIKEKELKEFSEKEMLDSRGRLGN